jgi:hypothetical protein
MGKKEERNQEGQRKGKERKGGGPVKCKAASLTHGVCIRLTRLKCSSHLLFEQVCLAKLGPRWPPTLAIGHGHGFPPYKKAIQIGQMKPTNTFVFPKQLGKKKKQSSLPTQFVQF